MTLRVGVAFEVDDDAAIVLAAAFVVDGGNVLDKVALHAVGDGFDDGFADDAVGNFFDDDGGFCRPLDSSTLILA